MEFSQSTGSPVDSVRFDPRINYNENTSTWLHSRIIIVQHEALAGRQNHFRKNRLNPARVLENQGVRMGLAYNRHLVCDFSVNCQTL